MMKNTMTTLLTLLGIYFLWKFGSRYMQYLDAKKDITNYNTGSNSQNNSNLGITAQELANYLNNWYTSTFSSLSTADQYKVTELINQTPSSDIKKLSDVYLSLTNKSLWNQVISTLDDDIFLICKEHLENGLK